MRLVYTDTGEPVKAGDAVMLSPSGGLATITGYREPHKAGSTGRVYVKRWGSTTELEYFPSVVGARWIERTDGGA